MSLRHRFEHPAMNTTFSIRLPDHSIAPESLAREVFELLEGLEDRLSLYREGSDVWRLNRLRAGECLVVSDACYQCLRLAMGLHAQTAGFFDVTAGRQIAALKNRTGIVGTPNAGLLAIDPDKPMIHCIQEGRQIDLGGIGKGFALDQMAQRLKDFDLPEGFLSAGASSHLAFGDFLLTCKVGPVEQRLSVHLKNAALSASGDAQQGPHIVSPFANVTTPTARSWILAHNATAADAWSTAAAILPIQQFNELAQHSDDLIQAWIVSAQQVIHWKKGP